MPIKLANKVIKWWTARIVKPIMDKNLATSIAEINDCALHLCTYAHVGTLLRKIDSSSDSEFWYAADETHSITNINRYAQNQQTNPANINKRFSIYVFRVLCSHMVVYVCATGPNIWSRYFQCNQLQIELSCLHTRVVYFSPKIDDNENVPTITPPKRL